MKNNFFSVSFSCRWSWFGITIMPLEGRTRKSSLLEQNRNDFCLNVTLIYFWYNLSMFSFQFPLLWQIPWFNTYSSQSFRVCLSAFKFQNHNHHLNAVKIANLTMNWLLTVCLHYTRNLICRLHLYYILIALIIGAFICQVWYTLLLYNMTSSMMLWNFWNKTLQVNRRRSSLPGWPITWKILSSKRDLRRYPILDI